MLWEVEIAPKGTDTERQRVAAEYDLLTHSHRGAEVVRSSRRGYLLEGHLSSSQAEQVMGELLVDPLTESGRLSPISETQTEPHGDRLTVLLKPGVMDPAAQSVLDA